MDGKTKFANGFYAKPRTEKQPEWVMAKFGIKLDELDWFRSAVADAQSSGKEFLNFDIRMGKNGKAYVAVDDWEPKPRGGASDNAPF
tara:strand:- start:565 stop:825 length:261 start_codon:yes stop_codon:yes gene_type:complete